MDDVPTDVQIAVTKVIKPTGRGILVSGHVDSGLVHTRDILQVHNHQPGATTRVGRMYQGGKRIQEAQAGNDIKLLLERIEETEIHPGDQLLPGEKKDLRSGPKKDLHITGKESWKKLPERIEPLLHFRQFIGKIALLDFFSILWVVPIFILRSMLREMISTGLKSFLSLGFWLVWYGIISVITYKTVKAFIDGLKGRSRFLRAQSQAVAQILRRVVVEHESYNSDYRTFHLQMEFTPTQATVNTGAIQLEAQISEKLYESLRRSQTIKVTYAIDDPRIVVIEGE